MNSKKIIGIIIIILVFVFPFKYAVLSPSSSNLVNLISFLATIFGTLIFMALTLTEGKGGSKK